MYVIISQGQALNMSRPNSPPKRNSKLHIVTCSIKCKKTQPNKESNASKAFNVKLVVNMITRL